MKFTFGVMVVLCMAYDDHARFDDINIDACKVTMGRQRPKISVEFSQELSKQ